MEKVASRFTGFLRRNWKSILVLLAVTAANFIVHRKIFLEKGMASRKAFWVMAAFFAFFEIVLCSVIIAAKKKKWSIEKLYLILFSLIGSLYFITIPILRAPDESAHFLRAYEVSNGAIITSTAEDGKVGNNLPSSLEKFLSLADHSSYRNVLSNLKEPLNPGETKFYNYPTSAVYSPVNYAPQVVGMSVGKILCLSPAIIAYLGRLANLVFFIVVTFFSIKYIPFFKKTIFLICFLPATIQSAASLSPDSITIASSIALLSFVLYSVKNLPVFTKKHYLLMAVLALIISQAKIVYFPLLALLLLIPRKCFGSKKNKVISLSLIIAVASILLLVWLKISASFLGDAWREGVDSYSQITFILTHPLQYVQAFAMTMLDESSHFIASGLGSQLEYFSVNVPTFCILLLFVILILVIRSDVIGIKKYFTNFQRFVLFATPLSIIVLVATALYIQWTPTGLGRIEGIQGRYFLPILAFVPLCISSVKTDKDKKESTPSNDTGLSTLTLILIITVSFCALSAVCANHL